MTAPAPQCQPSIVERIRQRINDAPMPIEQLLDDAADRIEALEALLDEARLQIEYLGFKFQHTGTSEAVLSRITAALSSQEPGK